MQTNDFSNLPTSWQIKTLGEVCEICTGNSINKEKKEKEFMGLKEGLNYIATKDIGFDNTINYDNGVKIPFKDLKKFRVAKANVSLLCIEGGSAGRKIGFTNQEVCFVNKLCCFEALQDEPKFIYFYLQSSYFLQKFNLNMSGLIGGISKEKIKQIKIPLPPLEIQKRIVARLESAFEKIEKGSAHLQDAKTKLVKYKQSLLKSAFDGTLTAAASLQGVEKAETIHKVDCHDLTSSNLAMTDKENPKLPQGWTIKTLGEVFKVVGGGTPSTKQADNFGGDIAWITPADLSNHNNKFISQGKRNISEKGLKNSSARLVPKGTILFSSRAPIGYVAIASNQLCTNQGFKNLIPNKNVSSEFVYYYLLNSKNLAESYASGTTFKEISAKSFSKLPIPLPPLETQKQIVKLLEKHLQHADKTGKFIESALNKAKQLKQSLLKSAFLGKLT